MDFILLSKVDEDDKLGSTLTSSTHGFKFESINISKPYISKHEFRVVEFFYTFRTI